MEKFVAIGNPRKCSKQLMKTNHLQLCHRILSCGLMAFLLCPSAQAMNYTTFGDYRTWSEFKVDSNALLRAFRTGGAGRPKLVALVG